MSISNDKIVEQILGKKLLFIIAHPDDESYLAAGTIDRNQKAGGESFVICATAGEKGQSHLPHPLPPEQLKQIRQHELEAVGHLLHLHNLILLDLPDGEVAQHQNNLEVMIEPRLTASLPDYIISFGSDGITGHKDHIAIGKSAKTLALKLAVPFLAFCRPSSISLEILKRRRRFGKYVENITRVEPNLKLDIDPQIKWSALCCHRSQMEHADPLADFPETVKQELLHHEYFYADWL